MKKIMLLALLLPTLALAERRPDGTYDLPAGNPVVSGTKITATWANGTMNDIAAALTDSLSRSGKGGMTVPFYLSDGTEAGPGISFTNEQGTGAYRAGNGDVRISVLGKDALSLTQTSMYFGDSTTGGRWKIPTSFDAVFYFPGKMINDQLLARVVVASAIRLQAGLPGSVYVNGAAGTGAVTITLKKLVGGTRTDIGTINYLAGGFTPASVVFSSDVDFAAGNSLEIWGPAVADATFADLSITLVGRRP